MITEEDIKSLEFLHDREVEFYGESPNTDYLIRFRKVITKIQNLDEPETEDVRAKLWRDAVVSAAKNGRAEFATKTADTILNEYDNRFKS